jgi:hypothetical protein
LKSTVQFKEAAVGVPVGTLCRLIVSFVEVATVNEWVVSEQKLVPVLLAHVRLVLLVVPLTVCRTVTVTYLVPEVPPPA